jgi:hypothetical protein
VADQDNPFMSPQFAPAQRSAPTSNNPFMSPQFAPRTEAQRLAEEDPFLARTAQRVAGAVDTVTDIGEGILSGGVNFAQGLAELPAIGFDAAFGTNSSRAVRDFFAPVQEFAAPETTAGRVAADLTAYGVTFVPIAGWLSRAAQGARLAKAGAGAAGTIAGRGPLSSFMRSADQFGRSSTGQRLLSTRARQIGTTALATGAFSALVTPDGRATLSDSFEVLPNFLETERDTGLRGRDEAFRLIRNRGRQFVEDAALSGTFDVGLAAIGAGTRQVARLPQVADAANAFADTLQRSNAAIAQRFPESAAVLREYFTPTGGADPLLFGEAELGKASINAELRAGKQAADELTSLLPDLEEPLGLLGNSRQVNRQLQGEVGLYLEGLSDTLPSVTDETLRKKATDILDRMIANKNNNVDDRVLARVEAIANNPALDDTTRQAAARTALETLQKTDNAQGTHVSRFFTRYTNPVKFYKGLDLASPLAKEAQQEVAQNFAAMEGRDALEESIQERAKETVFKALGLGDFDVSAGLTDKQRVQEALKAAKRENRGEGKLGSLIAKDRLEFVTDSSIFIPQEEILSKSPKLRELLGEVTNPVERYLRTVETSTRAFVADTFYDSLPFMGLERPLMDAVAELDAGKRPAVVTVPDLTPSGRLDTALQPFAQQAREINARRGLEPQRLGVPAAQARPPAPEKTAEELVQEYTSRLVNKYGYVQLGEASKNDVFGGIYGSASGKYVSPETYRAITQPLRLTSGIGSEVVGMFSNLRNVTQKMTIVPNLAAQVRSILGNIGSLAGNANLPNGADITDLLYTFVASTKDLDDAGLTRLAEKIARTGIAETNLVLAALKQYQNAAEDLTVSGTFNRVLSNAEGFIPFMRAFESIYSNSDTFFKGAALLAEEGTTRNMLAKAGVSEFDPDLVESLVANGLLIQPISSVAGRFSPIELMAAEIVKDTMPTYNRVVKAVKALDAIPVIGNFTSFAAENVRNSIGTVLRGVREAGYEAGPALRQRYGDAAIDALEQNMRARGLQRLLGYTTMAYVLPKTLVKLSMQATGTTEEEMRALYEGNPDFLDGHDLVIVENNRADKYVDFVDLSYVMPYAFVTDAAQAAIREFQEMGRADASTLSAAMQGIWRGFQMYADPFAAESMFYERFRNVMPDWLFGRNGVSATGAEIYGPNESWNTKGPAIFNHLMYSFAPNYATMLVEEQNGQLREGRLWRAYSGTPDRSGETTNPSKEIARLVTGFTPMRLNLKTDPQFMASEYLPLRTDSRTRALRGLKDAAATPGSVVSDWESYLDELYSAQTRLYRRVEALRTLGMNDDEILYAFIQGGMGRGEAVSVIDGRFDPTGASTETAEAIRNQLNREGRTRLLEEIDFGLLNDMTAARKDEPLRTAPEQRPEVLGPRPSRSQGNPFMAPQFAPRQAPAAPQGNPFMAPQFAPQQRGSFTPAPFAPPRQQGAVNPALLGETPAEQAANAQIAQRTGQA